MKTFTNLAELGPVVATWRGQSKTIVHCHGVFDLLHPGHVEHLQEAAGLGDVLVVTVTSDRFVNKGPGRPLIAEMDRAKMLAALECVNAVAISDEPNALAAIEAVKPDYYVKGPDYKDVHDDKTGNISLEQAAVERAGGELVVTTAEAMSSSNLRNKMLLEADSKFSHFLAEFRQLHSNSDITAAFEAISALRVLVVGEAIIDEYEVCEALGKTSKDPVLAFRRIRAERHLGGSLAIARHASGLGAKVTLLTRVNSKTGEASEISASLGPAIETVILESASEPTIIKRRFVDELTGNKVFETYDLDESLVSESEELELADKLWELAPNFDLVLVADYGHGLMSKTAVAKLCESKVMLSVNTQSNAGNRGFNSISKYPRVDFISLNGSEVALELRERHLSLETLVEELLARTGSSFAVVTAGQAGAVFGEASESGSVRVGSVPAFATNVKDRVGAGDALFVATSLAYKATGEGLLSTLIGNLAGAFAVEQLGNQGALDAVSVMRHVEAMLK